MWWTGFRGLSPRQRIFALVLIAVLIAAGVYRWVHFGNVNTLHGGFTTQVQTVTGEPELLPTTTEVEADARSDAKAVGKLKHLACRPIPSAWVCTEKFAGGAVAVYRGIWLEKERQMSFALQEWKATLHASVPVGG
jgi:hypothetical protein